MSYTNIIIECDERMFLFASCETESEASEVAEIISTVFPNAYCDVYDTQGAGKLKAYDKPFFNQILNKISNDLEAQDITLSNFEG